jgi:hypothetical protein
VRCGDLRYSRPDLLLYSLYKIFHVRREQNVAAHLLARSCDSNGCRMWRGVPPDCIRETICIDIMSVD